MNTNMLKGKLRENGLTQEDMAAKMGVSLSRFNAKVNARQGAEFSLGELRAMKGLLGLTGKQMEQIFFT